MADDYVGPVVEKSVTEIPEGGVLLLENLRFYKEEENNDPEFAKKLASLADLYVNDAFGTAHRTHASTEGVAKHLKPSVAGFLMQKEHDYLVGVVSDPKKPFAAIVGGSKVSSKIGVIESLLNKFDILILGGGMIFTFYKAQGLAVGSSLVEEDNLDLATSLLEKAKAKGVSLLLPFDVVIADKFVPDANSKIVPASSIPDGWMGLDIGPDSIKTFSESLDTTKTVIWNGSMGVVEFEKFAAGTELDTWKWSLDDKDKGMFTVRRLRELIDEKILHSPNDAQETRWCKIVPRKICIFIWRLQRRRLPVFEWLHHIGIDLNSTLCSHCGDEIESLDHCFLRCNQVVEGWKKVFKWWKLGSFDVQNVEDILCHKGCVNFHKKQRTIWQAVCSSMLYIIWSSRNKRVFENKVSNLTTFCDELQVLSYYWISIRAKGSISSWLEWCSDPVKACKF